MARTKRVVKKKKTVTDNSGTDQCNNENDIEPHITFRLMGFGIKGDVNLAIYQTISSCKQSIYNK